jgi:hypothetical protein
VQWPVNVSLGYYQVILTFTNSGGFGTTIIGGTNTLTNLTQYYPTGDLPGAGGLFIAPYPAPAASPSVQQLSAICYVKVQAPGNSIASINLFVSASLPSGTVGRVFVTQMNGNVAETGP